MFMFKRNILLIIKEIPMNLTFVISIIKSNPMQMYPIYISSSSSSKNSNLTCPVGIYWYFNRDEGRKYQYDWNNFVYITSSQ